jgi:hypothetical protein
MPRSVIVTSRDMNKRRASNWECHYQHRGAVKLFSCEDAERVNRKLIQSTPAPVMLMDGSLLDGIENVRAQSKMVECFPGLARYMMCAWYWSESGWQDLVSHFQSLPEIFEDYYMFYDANLDAMRLMPVSTLGNNRPKKAIRVQGEVRGKSGGTMALPPEMRGRGGRTR